MFVIMAKWHDYGDGDLRYNKKSSNTGACIENNMIEDFKNNMIGDLKNNTIEDF